MVNSVFMLSYLVRERDKRAVIASPISCIPILDAVLNLPVGLVRVTAEDDFRPYMPGVPQGTLSHFGVQPLPVRMQLVENSGQPLLEETYVLQP